MRVEIIMDERQVTITRGKEVITRNFKEKLLAYCHILDLRDEHVRVGYEEEYFDFGKNGTIKIILVKEDVNPNEELKLVIEQTPVKKQKNVAFRLLAWVAHLFGHYKEV